jgi:hypothetical protein
LREKKKKKRNSKGAFFPGQDMPCWLGQVGFSQLLGVINSSFMGQSLNLCVPNVLVHYYYG